MQRPSAPFGFAVAIVAAALVAAFVVVALGATPPLRTPAGKDSAVTASKQLPPAGLPRYSASGYDITRWTKDEVEAAAKRLTDEQRRIMLHAGTEAPFCGQFTDTKEEGIYVCALGGLPLFSSEHKFTSKSGWASFFKAFDPEHILYVEDRSHGMVRVEILCARTGAHLGHVFDDGPPPTGRRYCLNSEALRFIPKGEPLPAESRPVATEVAYFGGGCFWGVEDAFEKLPGVLDAESGFSNGKTATVTYKEVCRGDTGHNEVVKIVFDPKRISYGELLKVFFRIHDPTTLNRQGPDIGTQYRSGIYVTGPEQEAAARAAIAALNASEAFRAAFKGRPVVTEILPIRDYCTAEAYHQDYHAKNGGSCHSRGFTGEMPW